MKNNKKKELVEKLIKEGVKKYNEFIEIRNKLSDIDCISLDI